MERRHLVDLHRRAMRLGPDRLGHAFGISIRAPVRSTAEFDGTRVDCLDQDSLHRTKRFALVVPIDEMAMMCKSMLIFKGLNRVATNSPSHIVRERWGGDHPGCACPVPAGCVIEGRVPAQQRLLCGRGRRTGPTSNRNPYRLLVMADHSIFINQMLLEPQTDNLELTYRVIEFLQGPGKQQKAMHLLRRRPADGTFDDLRQAYAKQNSMPMPQVNLMGNAGQAHRLGNAIIDRLQTNDAHNSLILGSDRESQPHVIARFFLILATVVACFFLSGACGGRESRSDIPPPPAVVGRLDRPAGRLRPPAEGTPPPRQSPRTGPRPRA